MSRKHNTQHSRSQSKYPERLKKRGVSSASVRMEDLETLRKRQGYYDAPAPVFNFGYPKAEAASGFRNRVRPRPSYGYNQFSPLTEAF